MKSQEDVQQVVDKIDVVMAQNSKCRELWLEYIQFMESPQLDSIYTEAKKETKLAQIFDKALDNVGLYDQDSAEVWLKYIDFEILRDNMAKVNLLCFMALETPLNGEKLKEVKDKYTTILGNSFEVIFESITSDSKEEGEADSPIPDKYTQNHKKVVKLITDDFGGDKQKFITFVSEKLYAETLVKF